VCACSCLILTCARLDTHRGLVESARKCPWKHVTRLSHRFGRRAYCPASRSSPPSRWTHRALRDDSHAPGTFHDARGIAKSTTHRLSFSPRPPLLFFRLIRMSQVQRWAQRPTCKLPLTLSCGTRSRRSYLGCLMDSKMLKKGLSFWPVETTLARSSFKRTQLHRGPSSDNRSSHHPVR
jgi:hypothetical protein